MKQVFIKGDSFKITVDTEKDILIAKTESQFAGQNQKSITEQFRHDCRNKTVFYYTHNVNQALCKDILNESVYEINISSLLTILLQDRLKDNPQYNLTNDGKKLIDEVKEI